MPGIPVRGGSDQRERLSAEEQIAAEESLKMFCRPVELYNILERRAKRNQLFLERCLNYKIRAKNKKRNQMTVSLSRSVTESQSVFPLYIFLGRLVPDDRVSETVAVYRISRIFMFRNSSDVDPNAQVRANFTLPEANKLAEEARSRSLAVFFVSAVGNSNLASGISADLISSFESRTGEYCFCGQVSLESLYMAWDSSPNFKLGQRAEIMSTVDLRPCILKMDFQKEDTRVSVEVPRTLENGVTSKKVQITVSAEQFAAKEKSLHQLYGPNAPSSSVPHLLRFREGSVTFNYRYYNNRLERREVTQDFTCPFCLVKCASYQGLKYHLPSSHDHFNYEFWVTEMWQAVNVSVKDEIWRYETVGDGIDPRKQTFFFCARPLMRRGPKNLSLRNVQDVNSLTLESSIPAGDTDTMGKDDGISTAIIPSHPDPDCIQSASGYDLGTPTVLEFAKTRKLSIEGSDPRNFALLRKRQFFHSHRAQPMAIEQVLSDQDSEDEVDDDVADYEDQRMLDNFVDVSKDEKEFMHMWNSFVRKHHVIADGHVPWACEAFSKLHAPQLVGSRLLAWCWRLFMIKLYNHALLDARTMNECNIILEQYSKQNSDP